ncbi:MAG: hypothetical protein GX458_09530 [Phyllobacteriaceae bacterium]|nr:hypothetical protein [Phyllobacteriaceae bacterium]
MTPSPVTALVGSMRLLGGDRRGLEAMDLSLDGFWASFRVMLWLAPAVALSLLADLRLNELTGTPRQTGDGLVILAGVVSYVAGWVAFPLLLAALGRTLGLGRVFVPWMVARNWTAIPASLPYVVVVIAWLAGVLPTRGLGPATLAALGVSLFCGWRVAMLAGGRSWGTAVAYTLVDFMLGLLIESGADRLFGL